MKQINILSKFIALCICALFADSAKAQMASTCGEVFIKGDYVEVGISPTAAFGACCIPAGYHPRSAFGGGSTSLGFVADPDKDGWLVSLPGRTPYMGDYFVPGTPYEAFDVQINGNKYSANNCPSGGAFSGATFTGTGYGNISYTATATDQTAIWHGLIGTSLDITQTTVVKKSKAYFVMYVDFVNTGSTTLNNIYYQRALDPDNDETWPLGNFTTTNKVVYQPNALSKNCLVTANGLGYANAYLGLGTKDCRAKCYILNAGLSTGATLDAIYNQTGAASSFYYNVGKVDVNDEGVGLVYNLGNLAPGQKTSLAYAYILSTADLDSALGETAPKFVSGGVPYSPYTTFRVCPGKTVPLKVINGGQYRWIWTPSTYMLPVTGTTIVGPGGTVPAITGSTTYPNGAAAGDSVLVQVFGPKTYVAMGISNCDTQYLTFYVDTISFAVPPSVTTPVRYCEGDAATALTAGAATGATLQWYTVPTGGTGSATAPTPSTTFTGTGSFDTVRYYVSQINAAGCETPRAKIDVIITKKPLAPTVVTPVIYCIGATTLPLTAVGSSLKWYDAATAGTRYSGTPTPANTPAGTTGYFVSQTVNGCESDRTELDVIISQITANYTKLKDSLCGPELNVYTGKSINSTGGPYSSAWSFGDGTTDTNVNTSHAYADLRADVTVKLIVTNENGCQDSTKQQVHIFPVPTMTISGSDTLLCQGGSVDFSGTATPGYNSLTWDFGDGDPAYDVLTVRHAFTKAGLFNVKVSGTYPACPGVNAAMNVNIIPIPNVNLGRDTSICPGNSMLSLHNLNTAAVGKYIWSTGDTTASIMVAHEGDYWLKAMNGDCNASDSISITKACYLDIPNAFTPGSGNDIDGYFLPRQLLSKSVVTFEMKIFDRWGSLLFESGLTDGRGWDGTYKGQPSPFGVYVYLIKVSYANGLSESYQGNVTLIR